MSADFAIADMQIMPPDAADMPAVRELYYESMTEGSLIAGDTGADIDNIEEAYFADDGDSAFWVGKCGDEVIGMIGVQKTSDNMAEIRRLRVKLGYRRRGVGTRLMEQAMEFCRDKGYLKVVLDVRIDRGPAIALFEKAGFHLARKREINGRQLLDFFLDLYRERDD